MHKEYSEIYQQLLNPSEAFAKLNVELKTNDTLLQVAELIQTAKPDWECLINRARKRETNHEKIQGLFGEIHLHQILKKTAKSRQFRGKVKTHPIPQHTQTENFSFVQEETGNFSVIHSATKRNFAEYDAITLVDNLPVIWETKIAEPPKIISALNPDRINTIFTPLKEYYRTNEFGYVIVTIPEAHMPGAPIRQVFQQKGGLIIPLAAGLEEFRSKAISASTIFDAQNHDKKS